MTNLWRSDDDKHSSSLLAIYLQQIIKLLVLMTNESNFGKVTHDNLPQAVEHPTKLLEVQVENQNKGISMQEIEVKTRNRASYLDS